MAVSYQSFSNNISLTNSGTLPCDGGVLGRLVKTFLKQAGHVDLTRFL